jgi:hypothetical protein
VLQEHARLLCPSVLSARSDSSAGRSAAARQNDSLDGVGQPTIDVCLEGRDVHAHGETVRPPNLSAVRDQASRQRRGALDRKPEVLDDTPSEGDLANGADGEATNDAVSGRLRASHVDAREKVVNPLSLYFRDKASYINMIRRHN